MRTTTTYHFDGPSRSVERKGHCPTCGKPVTRRRTFQHTVSPFNKDPETGQPRTWAQVAEQVRAEADAWNPTPEQWEHERCYDARHAPTAAGYEPVGEDVTARYARERALARTWLDWTEATGLPLWPVPMSWSTNREDTRASVHHQTNARVVCALADVCGVTTVKISRTDGDLAVRFTARVGRDEVITLEVVAFISPTARGVAGKVDRPKGDTLTVDELAAWIETTGQVQYSRMNR